MRFLFRWLSRAILALVAVVLLLLAPVGYVELACTGPEAPGRDRSPIVAPEWQRAESRTLTTYPEWHIVHAYDDYAKVIETGDPHDFAYLPAVAGFWTALCPLKAEADRLGGMTPDQRVTIYTIGVSFTAEVLAKAAYEETLGRIATLIRGGGRARLDELSARQAAAYAHFLQQTPWYKWDFAANAQALETLGGDGFRDRERRFALGTEYAVKAAYARQIEMAVAGLGADALRMRSIVAGLAPETLAGIDGVAVVASHAQGVEIETGRYRAFTRIAARIAAAGGEFVEIAGNFTILYTALSDAASHPEALHSFPRQGYGDSRHLFLAPVGELGNRLRDGQGPRLEHIHDY